MNAPRIFTFIGLPLRRIAHVLCACTVMFSADAALACWNACSIVPPKNGGTPQKACEYAGIERAGHVIPYRLAWLREGGGYEGFYHPGFEVPGPTLPNPENNYQPYSPSQPYCILDEQNVCPLDYYGYPSCDAVPLLQVALTLPTETRPASTGGVSIAALVAKVTLGGAPKPGVVLGFSVDVTSNSGGHDHDINRPKGTLSATQGTTDANGEVKLTFQAPEAAGTHTFKANCASCSNSPATKEIQVKVPNLVEMLPDTAKPATYTLVGATGNHKSNHWFTTSAGGVLQKVADAMFKTGWGAVGVNDGSLMWGGLFDIKGGWTPSHHEHRVGSEVDLSVTNPRNVTDEQKKKTYAELCKKDNTAFSIQTLWHQDDGYPEHFHMYLDGTGLDSQAKGGPCCTRYKTTRAKLDRNGNPVLDKNGKPVQETVALCEETSPR